MALSSTNKVFLWGIFALQTTSISYASFDGTSGAGSYKNAPYAMNMAFLGSKTIENIYCSPATAFILTTDGFVFSMGYNTAYQLDPFSASVSPVINGFVQSYGLNPNTLNAGEYVTSIAPNALNTAIVTNKRAYVWGRNSNSQIALVPSTFDAVNPVEIVIPGKKIVNLFTNNMPTATTLYYFFAAITDGCSYPSVTLSRGSTTSCTGGKVYYSTTSRASVAYNAGMLADKQIIDMSSNGGYYEGYAMFLTSAGKVYSLGGAENGRVGDGTSSSLWTAFKTVSTTVMNTFIVMITTGYTSAAAVSSDNNFYVWGYSSYGESTDGDPNENTTPVLGFKAEIGARIIVDIQGGTNRFSTRTADGRVFSWGYGSYGKYFYKC
jgi:alpha-tubulin suppressor-like RCC1 family protein